jgi:hypothetical protein
LIRIGSSEPAKGDLSLRHSDSRTNRPMSGSLRTRDTWAQELSHGSSSWKGMIMPPRVEVVRSGPWSELFPSRGRGQPSGIALVLEGRLRPRARLGVLSRAAAISVTISRSMQLLPPRRGCAVSGSTARENGPRRGPGHREPDRPAEPHTQIAAGLEQLVNLTRVTLACRDGGPSTEYVLNCLIGRGCGTSWDPPVDEGMMDSAPTPGTAPGWRPRVRQVPAATALRGDRPIERRIGRLGFVTRLPMVRTYDLGVGGPHTVASRWT